MRSLRTRIKTLERRSASPAKFPHDLTLLSDAELDALWLVLLIRNNNPADRSRLDELPVLAAAASIPTPDISWPAIGEAIREAIYQRHRESVLAPGQTRFGRRPF
jgi:hypothetical protein